jgi:uncharacterized membrane protein YjjB (DUF3815 family)
MTLAPILVNSLWAALFSSGLGVILTSPPRALVACFLCGFAGRFVRDVATGWGLTHNWSTVIAATVVALLAMAIARHHRVSPVVLICGVLPLGASIAMFSMIVGLMKVASLKGDALIGASVALSADFGKAFTGTLAIALGLRAGMLIAQLLQREEVDAG